MEITLNQVLNLAQLIVMLAGGLWAVIKIGAYFTRLITSIEKVLEDHERRITVLEGGRDNVA